MCASLLDLASQSRVDGNGEIENRPEDGAYPGVIRRIIAGLPPGSLTAQRNTAISHGAPRRSLTVLDHNQHVTIVAVVSVVARDDTGVSDEPGNRYGHRAGPGCHPAGLLRTNYRGERHDMSLLPGTGQP